MYLVSNIPEVTLSPKNVSAHKNRACYGCLMYSGDTDIAGIFIWPRSQTFNVGASAYSVQRL